MEKPFWSEQNFFEPPLIKFLCATANDVNKIVTDSTVTIRT